MECVLKKYIIFGLIVQTFVCRSYPYKLSTLSSRLPEYDVLLPSPHPSLIVRTCVCVTDFTSNIIDLKNLWIENIYLILQVDFQLCTYASAALDLIYLLNSSISFDVIEHKTDILLNEYLHILSTTMKQLNCKTQPPTMKELKASIKRRASYGMLTSFIVLPLMLCCKSEAKDLDEVLGSSTYINPGLKNEIFKKILIKRLPLYDEWGLLDL